MSENGARMIHLSKLDPCMGFAYLIKDREDFIEFQEKISAMWSLPGATKIFGVFETQEQFVSEFDSKAIETLYSYS